MKNNEFLSQIASQIADDTAFSERHLICTHYTPITKNKHISAYYDSTDHDINEYMGIPYVVYLIKSGDRYYIGITDCVSRRMQEHIDSKETIISSSNGTIIYKVIYTAQNKEDAKDFEHSLISRTELFSRKNLLNKIK